MADSAFLIERLFHPLTDPTEGDFVLGRLAELPQNPLNLSQFNQLLHRSHEAGMEAGFFSFYFLLEPTGHPFKVPPPPLALDGLTSVQTTAHLRWGIDRFALDAAFFYGDFRNAYRDLRTRSYDEIADHFSDRARFPTESLRIRGPVMPLNEIPIADRHLVSELAYKALDPVGADGRSVATDLLVRAFNDNGGTPTELGQLVEQARGGDQDDAQLAEGLPLATGDIAGRIVESAEDIVQATKSVHTRFVDARRNALDNTKNYLSICNELDVYVTTSMREQSDFRDTGEACAKIFSDPSLSSLRLRWFDPTMSACQSHEDKGLVECLMVSRARLILHFAGEKDSWGKDAEAAMALSRGTPVVILCPDSEKGHERARIFRDIHPLSRLTDLLHGVAVGSVITTDEEVAVEVMRRYFENEMSYSLAENATGFVVREELTGSVVRIVTRDQMIRETFWNYYHDQP